MSEYDVSAVDLSGLLNKEPEEKARQVPDPVTYHILCMLPKAEEDIYATMKDRLKIKAPTSETKIATLSGGNQQKVVLGRWLSLSPKLLILDEPTKGVDVAAKAEISRIITEMATLGTAELLISSELPEVLALSDRVIVIRSGNISGELVGSSITQKSIMDLAMAI